MQPRDYDVDILLIYTDQTPCQIAEAVQEILADGKTVLAAKDIPRRLALGR